MVAFKLIGAAAFSSMLSSALAGNAILQNNCAYPVHVLGGYSGQVTTVQAGGKYTEVIKGGPSIKITKDKSKGFGKGITQFEYKIDNTLWYDISFIDCNENRANCPGWSGGVSISATGGTCSKGVCPPGAHCPDQAYFIPTDNKAVKSCLAGQNTGDITMVLCNAKKAKKSVAGRIQFETRDWEQHEEEVEEPAVDDEQIPEDFEEEGREVQDDEE
ncbi:hypothetical protein DM02DRAFT_723235 [Periconia macrospinosa]|uniref:Osmotin, thaumatin-like protein n=1 Tax=Periconia macrospinosa TaxID=97972 RepID=A0A2V1ECQ5_9PLEO|nr:hypothetical protein DM02DRAFT_723235 [Periconia macrospinosa]